MDNTSVIRIRCENCGREWDSAIWHSIINGENHDALNLLIDGKLFDHVCPDCGHVEDIDVPAFYFDKEKPALICYLTSISEIAEAKYVIESKFNDLGISKEKLHVRIASSQNEFREKVLLLQEDLDDRVVEVMKMLALESVRSNGYNQKFEEIRCCMLEDGYLNIDFLGDYPRHMRISKDYYDKMAKEMISEMDKEPTPIEVNLDYAIEFATAHDC